jgi:uncharacterized membrane protein
MNSTTPTELLSERGPGWWFALVCVMALAVILRLAGLGTWSFASDELGTFKEVRQFQGESVFAPDDPDRNVPKMVPLGMLLHEAGHVVFGTDEAGSRAGPALFGVLQILLVGIGLRRVLGGTTALVVVMLVAISPEHVFHSQYHRSYTAAAFFATLSFIAAARSIRSGSKSWMLVAVMAAMTGTLIHTVMGLVFPLIVLAIIVARFTTDSRRSIGPLVVAMAGSAIAVAFAGIYLYAMGHGKAFGYTWTGYSTSEALLSGLNQIGWPVAIFAVPGFWILWRRDRVQASIWGTLGILWVAALVLLPQLLPFHAAYVFPLSLPLFILAGVAVGDIGKCMVAHGRLVATLVLGAMLILDLPAIVSYYQDGNRHDFRAAANWIADHIGPNDVIVTVQGDKLTWYHPELDGRWYRLPTADFAAWAETKRPIVGQLWIVLPGGRAGLPQPWREWAQEVGRPKATIVHRRFDYHEYPIFILVADPPNR